MCNAKTNISAYRHTYLHRTLFKDNVTHTLMQSTNTFRQSYAHLSSSLLFLILYLTYLLPPLKPSGLFSSRLQQEKEERHGQNVKIMLTCKLDISGNH